ncbi:hypothetical protein ACFPRL_05665 [Pseudoclavibacter helvolus]
MSRGWLLSEQRCSSTTNPGFFHLSPRLHNSARRREIGCSPATQGLQRPAEAR